MAHGGPNVELNDLCMKILTGIDEIYRTQTISPVDYGKLQK